jgi:hypothetical protein
MRYRNVLRQFNKLRSSRGMAPVTLEEYLHRVNLLGEWKQAV